MKNIKLIAAGALLFALPALAWASEEAAGGAHEGGIPTDKILLHAVNLVLLLAVLYFALRTRLRDALKNRSIGVKRTIDESNTLRKDAQDRFAQLEQQVASFDQKLDQMRRDAEREARVEHEALVQRGRAEAAQIQRAAEQTIRDETERARTRLRQEAANLAIDVAQRHLTEQVGVTEDERLAQQLLGAVRGGEVADG